MEETADKQVTAAQGGIMIIWELRRGYSEWKQAI
jgi:hypothetical protein